MLELDESYVWDARRSLFKVNFVLGTSGIRRELGKVLKTRMFRGEDDAEGKGVS